MGTAWGLVIIVFSLLAWAGQAMSWLAPVRAEQWSLTEGEESVEPVYYADGRGEAVWDTLSLWTMLAAGVLLVADSSSWGYFGLVGGGMYTYFAGRGVFTRLAIQRRGYRIGSTRNVRVGYTFLLIWGVIGVITIVAAVVALPTS